jgi:hypothetical protein
MSTRWFVALLFLVAVLLNACQSKPTAAVETPAAVTEEPAAATPTEQPVTASPTAAGGGTQEPYPAPTVNARPSPSPVPSVLYPGAQDGDEVTWYQAINMMLNREVTTIVASGTPRVTLLLKDGRQLVTEAPSVEEVKNYLDRCGEPCQDIELEEE